MTYLLKRDDQYWSANGGGWTEYQSEAKRFDAKFELLPFAPLLGDLADVRFVKLAPHRL